MKKSEENIIEDDLWDHYSGLPSPAWYKYIKEHPEDEEDDIDDDISNGNVSK